MDGCMHACMRAYMDAWMDVWMHGCMDVWMYGCMMYVCMYVLCFKYMTYILNINTHTYI